MAENINAGWGRLRAEALLALKKNSGRVFLVMPSTHANWAEVSEALPGVDPQGTTRIFSTIQAAVDAAEDSADDVIVVADGYSETVTAAAGLDLDKIGLTIIGLGKGNRRPTINFTTATTADMDVDAEGIKIENFIFDLTGVDALAAPIDVNAANFWLDKCHFINADADGQATLGILTDANAGGFKMTNCTSKGSTHSGTTSLVRIVGGVDHEFDNCHFLGAYKTTAGAIEVTTTAAGVRIIKSTILNLTAASVAAVDFASNSTVVLAGNVFGIRSGTTPVNIDALGTFLSGEGYFLVGGNYYRNGTSPVAGTLL